MKDNFISTIPKKFIPYQLPKNWKWFLWSDLITNYQQGMIRSNSQLGKGNAEYLKMGDLDSRGRANFSNLARTEASQKEIEEFLLKEGDFLINVRNSKELVGKTCLIQNINNRTVLFNHMLVRMDHGSIELNYYINAFLNIPSSKKILDRIKQGTTTVIALYQRDLNKIPIPLPDNKTFNHIVELYKSISQKIELNNKINAELEAMAKTLYDYWFVQFDFPSPLSPKGGINPYKSSGGKMVWNEALKREIPEGWEVKKIKDIAKTGSGGTPKSTEKAYYENGTIPWINSGELNNAFIVSTENFISELGMNNSSAKLFPANTILMAMYGATAGKTSIISFEATTNQAICAIMPLKDGIFHYTKFVLDDMYQYLINLSTGSARDNLSQEKIKELNIVIPSDKIIKQFSETVKQFFYKIENNLKENQELASLRDWLLPMLMNGQVSVGEVAKEYQMEVESLGMVAEEKERYK